MQDTAGTSQSQEGVKLDQYGQSNLKLFPQVRLQRLGVNWNKRVGRRTGKLIGVNRPIRKDEHGMEVFEDYFSASESDMSSFLSSPKVSTRQNSAMGNGGAASQLEGEVTKEWDCRSCPVPIATSTQIEHSSMTSNMTSSQSLMTDSQPSKQTYLSRLRWLRENKIGRRTGKPVTSNKNIRKDEHGLENFDDYFSTASDTSTSNWFDMSSRSSGAPDVTSSNTHTGTQEEEGEEDEEGEEEEEEEEEEAGEEETETEEEKLPVKDPTLLEAHELIDTHELIETHDLIETHELFGAVDQSEGCDYDSVADLGEECATFGDNFMENVVEAVGEVEQVVGNFDNGVEDEADSDTENDEDSEVDCDTESAEQGEADGDIENGTENEEEDDTENSQEADVNDVYIADRAEHVSDHRPGDIENGDEYDGDTDTENSQETDVNDDYTAESAEQAGDHQPECEHGGIESDKEYEDDYIENGKEYGDNDDTENSQESDVNNVYTAESAEHARENQPEYEDGNIENGEEYDGDTDTENSQEADVNDDLTAESAEHVSDHQSEPNYVTDESVEHVDHQSELDDSSERVEHVSVHQSESKDVADESAEHVSDHQSEFEEEIAAHTEGIEKVDNNVNVSGFGAEDTGQSPEDVRSMEGAAVDMAKSGIDVAGNVIGSITRNDTSSQQQDSGVNFNKTRKRLSYSALELSEESKKGRKNRVDEANDELQDEKADKEKADKVKPKKTRKSKGEVHIIKATVSPPSVLPVGNASKSVTTLVAPEENDFLCLAPRSVLLSQGTSEKTDGEEEEDELSIVEENPKVFRKHSLAAGKKNSEKTNAEKGVKSKAKSDGKQISKKGKAHVKSKKITSDSNEVCDKQRLGGKLMSPKVQLDEETLTEKASIYEFIEENLSDHALDDDDGDFSDHIEELPSEGIKEISVSIQKQQSISDSDDDANTKKLSSSDSDGKTRKLSSSKSDAKSKKLSTLKSDAKSKKLSTLKSDAKSKRQSTSNDDAKTKKQSTAKKLTIKTTRAAQASQQSEETGSQSGEESEKQVSETLHSIGRTRKGVATSSRRSLSFSAEENETQKSKGKTVAKSKRTVTNRKRRSMTDTDEDVQKAVENIKKTATNRRKRKSASDSDESMLKEKQKAEVNVKKKTVTNSRKRKSTSDSNADNEDSENEKEVNGRRQSKVTKQSVGRRSSGRKVSSTLSVGSDLETEPCPGGPVASTPIAGNSMTVPTTFGSGISFNVSRRATLLNNIGSGYISNVTTSTANSSKRATLGAVELTPCITRPGRSRKSKGRRVTICPEENVEHQISANDSNQSSAVSETGGTLLPSPDSTPVHFAETTNNKTPGAGPNDDEEMMKVSEEQLIVPGSVPSGLRRSRRTRLKPVAWYKNERVVFDHTNETGPVIVGVAPSLEVKWKKLEREQKMKRRLNTEIRKARDHGRFPKKRLSMHKALPEGFVLSDKREITVINASTQEEDEIECIMPYNAVVPVGPDHQSPGKDAPYLISQLLNHPGLSVGHITINPDGEKPEQLVINTALVVHVAHGKVLVKVHKTFSVLQTGDSFFVPIGNTYSIKNMRSDPARLFYTIVKEHTTRSEDH